VKVRVRRLVAVLLERPGVNGQFGFIPHAEVLCPLLGLSILSIAKLTNDPGRS
jgi:hypothetical protein